jgi:signal transduction histidine kinase
VLRLTQRLFQHQAQVGFVIDEQDVEAHGDLYWSFLDGCPIGILNRPPGVLIRSHAVVKEASMALDLLLGLGAANAPLLSAFLEEIPVGVVVFDGQGRPLVHNTAITQIVGVLPGRVQEVPLESDPVGRALAGQAVLGETTQLRVPGGLPRAVRVSALADRSGAGVLLLVAPELDGNTREILGVVGHDLRNPLAAMRMTAQLLAKPDDMPEERRVTLARRLMTSSSRMDGIVRGLLDYARAAAGAVVKLQREPIDLAELAGRVIEEQELAHPGHTAERRFDGDAQGSWDPGRLEQVVAHLVANAFRHGAESPPPVVSIDGSAADRVRLAVDNQGPPIPPDLMARVFQPFSVAPRPPGTPRRHIGLGLFVVHELVGAHGGSVTGRSSDAGTRFEVALPRQPQADVTHP